MKENCARGPQSGPLHKETRMKNETLSLLVPLGVFALIAGLACAAAIADYYQWASQF